MRTENTISSKTKLSPVLSIYAMNDCSHLFIAVSTQQVLGLSPTGLMIENKLGCDLIQAVVLQLAGGTRGLFLQ